jgi:hypothetical protein
MKPNDVQYWRDQINDGLKFRKLFSMEEYWNKLEALFYSASSAQNKASPNLIYSNGDALISALVVPNPRVLIKPRRPDCVVTAPILESVDNMLISEMSVQEHLEDALVAAFLFGVGFLKVGFDSEYGYNPTYEVVQDSGITTTMFSKKGIRIEPSDTRPGMPWVAYVPPHDIVVPWGTRTCKTSRWITHRVVRHVDEVKADPKYSKKKNLQPTVSMEDFTRSYSKPITPFSSTHGLSGRTVSEKKGEFVELWEIHDRMTGRVKVIATGHDEFLRDEVDLIQVAGLPFTEVRLVPRCRSLWVTPDSYFLLPHQAELMDITAQAAKQRRIRVAQFLYDESAIEDSEVQKMTSGRVGAGIKVKGGREPSSAIHNIVHGNNLDLWMDAEHVRRDANDTIGFSRNQLGAYDTSSRRTASEAQIVDRAAGQRLGRKLLAVSGALRDMMQKVNTLIQQYWKTRRVTQALGADGQQHWFEFTGKDLQGDFDYGIIFSSGQTETVESRGMQALQLYGLLSQDETIDRNALRSFLNRQLNDPAITAVLGASNANVQMGMPGVPQLGGASASDLPVPGAAALLQGMQGG